MTPWSGPNRQSDDYRFQYLIHICSYYNLTGERVSRGVFPKKFFFLSLGRVCKRVCRDSKNGVISDAVSYRLRKNGTARPWRDRDRPISDAGLPAVHGASGTGAVQHNGAVTILRRRRVRGGNRREPSRHQTPTTFQKDINFLIKQKKALKKVKKT